MLHCNTPSRINCNLLSRGSCLRTASPYCLASWNEKRCRCVWKFYSGYTFVWLALILLEKSQKLESSCESLTCVRLSKTFSLSAGQLLVPTFTGEEEFDHTKNYYAVLGVTSRLLFVDCRTPREPRQEEGFSCPLPGVVWVVWGRGGG